MLDILYSM